MGLGKALGGKTAGDLTQGSVSAIERQRPVEVAFVLDRSSSMEAFHKQAIKGFNAFIADQKKQPGEAIVSLRQFNDGYQTTYDNVRIADVGKMRERDFEPSGMTAIYDAIGVTIAEVMTRQTSTPIDARPSRTLIVILTDGDENASASYNLETVHAMVSRAREQFGWEFILIGMGIDAAELAVRVGIDARKALSAPATQRGMTTSMQSVSTITSRYRADGEIPPLLTGHKR